MNKWENPFNDEWAGFLAGERVLYHGKPARVIEARESAVPRGEVPITFDEDEHKEGESEFITVPADDLEKVKEEWEE